MNIFIYYKFPCIDSNRVRIPYFYPFRARSAAHLGIGIGMDFENFELNFTVHRGNKNFALSKFFFSHGEQ